MPVSLALTLLAISTSASPTAKVTWHAPEGCPSQIEVRRKLAAAFAREHISPPDVVVYAEVVAEDDGFLLHGFLMSGDRTQHIPEYVHTECQATVETLQAFIAPMFMPISREPTPTASAWRSSLRLGPIFDIAALIPLGSSRGEISAGGLFNFGFQRRRLRFELEVDYAHMRSQHSMLDLSGNVELRWNVLSVQPRLCGTAYSRAEIEVRLCSGPELDMLWTPSARGPEYAVGELRSIWGSIRGGPMLTWRMSRSVGLWLAAEPSVRLFPWPMEPLLDGSKSSTQEVLSLPRVSGRFGLGFELNFGGPT